MSVDPSRKAPAVRAVDYSGMSPQEYLENNVKPLDWPKPRSQRTVKAKKRLLDVVITNSGGSRAKSKHSPGIAQAHPGSLVAVLGMHVDLSSKSPPVRAAC
jgi:hypothetical protein